MSLLQPGKKRYVLLDRDGTIMVDKVYQKDPDATELFPGVLQGLEQLAKAGFGLVVITNQSGIARGLLTEDDLMAVNGRMAELLAARGVCLDGVYFCPHRPEDECCCRKPLPGMVEQAATDLGFAKGDCIIIGDRECDVDLAKDVGATAILVRTGGGREAEAAAQCRPDFIADDLMAAADWILDRF